MDFCMKTTLVFVYVTFWGPAAAWVQHHSGLNDAPGSIVLVSFWSNTQKQWRFNWTGFLQLYLPNFKVHWLDSLQPTSYKHSVSKKNKHSLFEWNPQFSTFSDTSFKIMFPVLSEGIQHNFTKSFSTHDPELMFQILCSDECHVDNCVRWFGD